MYNASCALYIWHHAICTQHCAICTLHCTVQYAYGTLCTLRALYMACGTQHSVLHVFPLRRQFQHAAPTTGTIPNR